MGVTTSARILVGPPVRTPLPYGLMSVAQLASDSDPHVLGGVRFETDACGPASVTTESCPATGGLTKDPTSVWEVRGTNPFTVYTMPVCAPIGNYENYEERVRIPLIMGEERAVEREFWTGDFGTTPHLAEDTAVSGTGFDTGVIEQTAATVVTGGPVDVVEGLALLEEELAECYGGRGVIHIPRSVLVHLDAYSLVRDVDGHLETRNGNLVAAGAGYTGTGPDGSVPVSGSRWIYATGAVIMRRSGVVITSSRAAAVDRAKNDMYLVAERTYVLGWECCHLGIPVKISGVDAGGIGT